jgi:phage terminase large subunit-like protein
MSKPIYYSKNMKVKDAFKIKKIMVDDKKCRKVIRKLFCFGLNIPITHVSLQVTHIVLLLGMKTCKLYTPNFLIIHVLNSWFVPSNW